MKKVVIVSMVVGIVAVGLVILITIEIPSLGMSRHRPKTRMPTITTLPEFPNIPTYGGGLNKVQKDEVIQRLVNHKVSTYPATSARSYRLGKFTSTGIFGGFPPTTRLDTPT